MGVGRAALVSVALLMVGTIAAQAIVVTNRDERDHKITLIEGETKSDHTLKPGQVLENLCTKGCVIRLNDSEDDDYEVEGTDVVSIEEGFLYYDGPDAPEGGTTPPAPSAGEQKSAPPATPAPPAAPAAPASPPAKQ